MKPTAFILKDEDEVQDDDDGNDLEALAARGRRRISIPRRRQRFRPRPRSTTAPPRPSKPPNLPYKHREPQPLASRESEIVLPSPNNLYARDVSFGGDFAQLQSHFESMRRAAGFKDAADVVQQAASSTSIALRRSAPLTPPPTNTPTQPSNNDEESSTDLNFIEAIYDSTLEKDPEEGVEETITDDDRPNVPRLSELRWGDKTTGFDAEQT